ncbi:unnamed protein product [Caenorhabditis brenneri]
MTSLLVVILLLLSFSFVCISDKLPDIRKSCKYQKILIESTNHKKLIVDWILPEHVRSIIGEECEHAKTGEFTFNLDKSLAETTRRRLLEECRDSNRKRRELKTKLPKDAFFEGYSKTGGSENIFENNWTFKCMIRDLLMNNVLHPAISRELSKEAEKKLKNHLEPNVRLNGVHSSKCMDNTTIRAYLEVMHPDELLIWKCEDIGEEKNNTYHFYNMEPAWMVEDENGKTFKINLHKCSQNKFNQIFCPPSSKVYHTATCAPNNIDSCQKTVIRPKRNIGSFARTLPDGISIYGTFKELTKIIGKSNVTRIIDPGLYYFSFKTSKLPARLAEKINKMM